MTPEELCRQVYAETRSLYEAKRVELGKAAHGFRVLYGPPVVRGPILFVGYQPGGTASHSKPDEHEGWPLESNYATGDPQQSPFWRHVQSVWRPPILAQSTGLNAIFFRAPNVGEWNRLSRSLRKEIEDFCVPRAEKIARALQPHRIIVIGTDTFDRLTGKTGEIIARAGNRRLIVEGSLWGAPATGVMHLSGARISSDDRERIKTHFAER